LFIILRGKFEKLSTIVDAFYLSTKCSLALICSLVNTYYETTLSFSIPGFITRYMHSCMHSLIHSAIHISLSTHPNTLLRPAFEPPEPPFSIHLLISLIHRPCLYRSPTGRVQFPYQTRGSKAPARPGQRARDYPMVSKSFIHC